MKFNIIILFIAIAKIVAAQDLHFDSTPATCAGNDGSIQAVLGCGTAKAPFEFNWSNGFIEQTNDTSIINNLTPGFYSVILKDANGCMLQDSVEVKMECSPPNCPDMQIDPNDVFCEMIEDDIVEIMLFDNQPPYTVTTSGGFVITNNEGIFFVQLILPIETITITNANGCVFTKEIERNIGCCYRCEANELIINENYTKQACIDDPAYIWVDMPCEQFGNPCTDHNFITQINDIQCPKDGDTICINLITQNEVVDGIIGIDYEITYPNQIMQPLGSKGIQLGEVVNNGGKGEDILNTQLADDRVRVSIYYTGNEGTEDLTGKGLVACVQFVLIGNPTPGTYNNIGTTEVELSFVNEFQIEPCLTTSFKILDNQPPTIDCSNETITLQLNANNEAFLDEPVVTDDCEVVSKVLSKQKFNCDDAGKTHQVNFTVIDDQGLEAICDITVYVAPPDLAIICPEEEFTPSFDDSGVHVFSPNDFGFPLTDVCDNPLTYTFNPPVITCVDANIEYVQVTITDIFDQFAECFIKIRWEIQQANVRVVYWHDERPIGSDETYDTNITRCEDEAAYVKVDEQGIADVTLLNPHEQFDVFRTKMCQADQNVVSAQDAREAAKISNKLPFLSNPFQLLAADYNDDGFVSAGDATQILDMAVGKICPDKKLWQFQKKTVFGGAEFVLDAGFPDNDDVGVDRADVHPILNCFTLATDVCEKPEEVIIYGILKGDVDGSWQKNSKYKTNYYCGVQLNFDNQTQTDIGNYIIPLSFETEGFSSAFDVDITFNESELNIVSVNLTEFAQANNITMAWNYLEDEHRLLISAFTIDSIEVTEPLFLVEIETAQELSVSIVANKMAFLEGMNCDIIDSVIEIEPNQFSIYPNPNMGSFQIELEKPVLDGFVEIVDASGKIVFQQALTNVSSVLSINLPNVVPGVYLVKVTGIKSVGIQKVMVH